MGGFTTANVFAEGDCALLHRLPEKTNAIISWIIKVFLFMTYCDF
jgi:hypothetical protein